MSRLVALTSGGDWTDASCSYLLVPEGIDLEKEKELYDEWYSYTYLNRTSIYVPAYKSFKDWLIEKGAREVGEDIITEFYVS